jgi:hypothetical protein
VARSRREQSGKVVRSGKPLSFQDEREGRFFDISVYPIFDAEGKVERVAIFAVDITERRQAMEALKVSFFIGGGGSTTYMHLLHHHYSIVDVS